MRFKLVFAFLLGSAGAFAQITSYNSPYSAFGLGDLQTNAMSANQAMGGISIGVTDRLETNFLNPAAIAMVRKAVFHFGARGVGYKFMSASDKMTSNDANLAYAALTLPIKKYWSLSAGLLPYSEMKYRITNIISLPDYSYRQTFNGTGGVNKVVLANGFKLSKNLSIGISGTYLFGDVNREQYINFPDSLGALDLRTSDNFRISNFTAGTGIQYRILFDDTSLRKTTKDEKALRSLTFGAKYDIGNGLNSDRIFVAERYRGGSVIDSVTQRFNTKDTTGIVRLPSVLGFGIAFEDFKHFLIGADFNIYNYTSVTYFKSKENYGPSYSFHLGGYYIPNSKKGETFWGRATYRAGVRYYRSPLRFGTTPLDEMAVSVGMTMPNRQRNNPFSSVSFALEVGQRGTTTNNMVKDQFVRLTLGFTLTDRFSWFVPSKYD